MGCKSFDVVRLHLGPSCLLLVLEVCNVKTTYRKSWAANLFWFQLSKQVILFILYQTMSTKHRMLNMSHVKRVLETYKFEPVVQSKSNLKALYAIICRFEEKCSV